MRTNEERAALVRQRTETIKEEQQRKKHKIRMTVLGGVSLAACLCLLVVMGSAMPQIISEFGEAPVSHTSGAASLLAGNETLGYVIVAIFAFLLGICVTLLLHVIHRRQQRQRHEPDGKASDTKESDGDG